MGSSVDQEARARLDFLVDEALVEVDMAVAGYKPLGVYAMFSGGYDSLASTSVVARHPNFSGVIHINTGIGIEQTRQFVRETCEREGWPLIERTPPDMTYEDMVLEHGFPGPGSHGMMYRNLKERAIRAVVYEIQAEAGEKGNVVLCTGVRTSESLRRMANIAAVKQRLGSQIWLAPIKSWSRLDTHRYVAMMEYPTNLASNTIHMSGECLCGSFATKGEFKEIEFWFPEAAADIRALEEKAKKAGVKHCKWGWGSGSTDAPNEDIGPLCSNCEYKAIAKETDA